MDVRIDVVPVNDVPRLTLGVLSLTISEDTAVSSLSVLREVSDIDGAEVTLALMDARSTPSTLFSTLPTLSASRITGCGTPTDVVLSGGVLQCACQWRMDGDLGS